jgi:hypothetical protein
VEDGVLTCRTKLFTLGKETILYNGEHNNYVLHHKIQCEYNLVSLLTLAILALPYWRGGGGVDTPIRKN